MLLEANFIILSLQNQTALIKIGTSKRQISYFPHVVSEEQ